MKYSLIASVVALALLTGCETTGTKYGDSDYVNKNKSRIVYRSLIQPRLLNKLENSTIEESCACDRPLIAQPSIINMEPQKKEYLIAFGNDEDSLLSSSKEQLDNIFNTYLKGEHYLLVGHSHGLSRKNVADLAVDRVENVRKYLVSKGLKKSVIHQYSSWSHTRDPLAPSRGVQVYVMDKAPSSNKYHIILDTYKNGTVKE